MFVVKYIGMFPCMKLLAVTPAHAHLSALGKFGCCFTGIAVAMIVQHASPSVVYRDRGSIHPSVFCL